MQNVKFSPDWDLAKANSTYLHVHYAYWITVAFLALGKYGLTFLEVGMFLEYSKYIISVAKTCVFIKINFLLYKQCDDKW